MAKQRLHALLKIAPDLMWPIYAEDGVGQILLNFG